MGTILYGEVSESNNDEDLEEWLGESSVSSHITCTSKNLTNIEECKIDVRVRNGQNMKCELKGTVNMKLQGGKTLQLNSVLYATQSVKNIMSVLRIIPKGATTGATKDKITIKKNGVNMILDTRKGKNESTMFYLKANRYYPEGLKEKLAQEVRLTARNGHKCGSSVITYRREVVAFNI